MTQLITQEDPIQRATSLFKSAEYKLVRTYVQSLIGADPTKPESFNLLGAVHERQGDYDTARRLYRAALALDPSYLPANRNLKRLVMQPQIVQQFAKIDLGEQRRG